MLAEHTAVDDFAFNILAVNGAHSEFDQAIGEEDARAGLDVLGQGLESGRDQVRGAGNVARSNGEPRSRLDGNGRAVFEAAGPELGSLQVLEDADGPSLFL